MNGVSNQIFQTFGKDIFNSVLFSGERQTTLELGCLHIISYKYCFWIQNCPLQDRSILVHVVNLKPNIAQSKRRFNRWNLSCNLLFCVGCYSRRQDLTFANLCTILHYHAKQKLIQFPRNKDLTHLKVNFSPD